MDTIIDTIICENTEVHIDLKEGGTRVISVFNSFSDQSYYTVASLSKQGYTFQLLNLQKTEFSLVVVIAPNVNFYFKWKNDMYNKVYEETRFNIYDRQLEAHQKQLSIKTS